MSTRSDILDALRLDLLTITTGNGYNSTLNSVVKHVKDFERIDETSLDFAYIFSLPESQEMNESIGTWTWKIGFMVYFTTAGLDANETGLIEDSAEGYIEDIKQLFNTGHNPPPVIPSIYGVPAVECIYVESIEQYTLLNQEHVAVVFGTLNIKYQD